MTNFPKNYNIRTRKTEDFWKRINEGMKEQEEIKKTMEYLERCAEIDRNRKSRK